MIAGGALVCLLVLLALAARRRSVEDDVEPAAATASATERAIPPSTAAAARGPLGGFLYGRVTTVEGGIYEGRLRWGRDQEAFWGDYFNGAKAGNPWVSLAPVERLPKKRRAIEILGFEIAHRKEQVDVSRLFMARFGDLARIEARGRDVRVTLKSGAAVDLDRLEASDFDDGLRVWDRTRGVVDLDSLRIRSVQLLSAPRLDDAPVRLHGTVRARSGAFTGFVQWDREESVGSDQLDGHTADGALSLRFDTIRSIARRSGVSSAIALLDGREVVLSDSQDVGEGHRGIYVDDRRYGRVLVSWDTFERVDFSPEGSGPAYGDFPPGRPLSGAVTTSDGRQLAGRLVYDLDESETTETLDAPAEGVDYTIPFGLIASIVTPGGKDRAGQRTSVTLHDGEVLRLEGRGDLGDGNAGVLVFVDGTARPQYVPWTDVRKIELDRPPAMYPPLGTDPDHERSATLAGPPVGSGH
jgi:hypothetical protein